MWLETINTQRGTLVAVTLSLLCVGCASPGPPRAPSLHLPEPARNLAAQREAGNVLLTFTVSARTTDKLLLREKQLGLRVCRETDHGSCEAIPLQHPTASMGTNSVVDSLPTALATGQPRLLSYRVELLNDRGKSAGLSETVYTVAGSAPAAVENISAKGTRLGVLLTWSPTAKDGSTVILSREEATHKSVLLHTNDDGESRTLDTGAKDDVAYTYLAHREREVKLGGRTLLMRGPTSAAVNFTLRDLFPPPVPTDVTAAGFADAAGAFAVDLIWQPVDDPGLVGYNIYRDGIKLNAAPVSSPSFHDATATAAHSYKYGVTAIDRKGNESTPGTAELHQ